MPLARDNVVPRLRPGDRPVPVDAPLSGIEVRTLRARASRVNLGADAYVALLAERRALIDLVGEERVAQVAERVRLVESRTGHVAASELQPWWRLLAGLARPAPDDLPTVYLPLRLAVALPANERARVVADAVTATDGDVEQAILFETTATSFGLTMQTWLLAFLLA
jgi:hypothetical protein